MLWSSIWALWHEAEIPAVQIEEEDMDGMCLFISADAFLEWEEMVSRLQGCLSVLGWV